MNPNPLDPNQSENNPPDMQAARSRMTKEWAMVFIGAIVMIIIVGLVAWRLTRG